MQTGDPILRVDGTRIHTDRFVDGFGDFRVCRPIAQRSLLRIPALLIAAAYLLGVRSFRAALQGYIATRHRPTYKNRPISRAPRAVSAYRRGRAIVAAPKSGDWVSHPNWWGSLGHRLRFPVRDRDGSRLHGQHDGVAVGCVELDRDQCAHVRHGILAAPSKWGRLQNVRDPEGLKPRSRLGDRTGERRSASTKAGRLPQHLIIKELGKDRRRGELAVHVRAIRSARRRSKIPLSERRAYSSGPVMKRCADESPSSQPCMCWTTAVARRLARLSWRQLLGRPEPLMPHWRRRTAGSAPRAKKEPTSGRGKQQSSVEDPLRSAVAYVGRRVRS
jgi:hypothetical protein